MDDIRRWRRDQEVNGQMYRKVLSPTSLVKSPHGAQTNSAGTTSVPISSAKIKVGDLIIVEKVSLIVGIST